jgi:Zn-dependent M28 family amino/carboxypeptidase
MVNWKEYKNIICRFKWKDDEKIIIWAHYDIHQEYTLNNLESWIFSWADDNASGVAWLLELTRLIWKNKKKLNNSIEFVAYTLEEQPYFATRNMGSFIHAKSLKDSWANIKYMIALEMIWYFNDESIQSYPIKFLNLIYPSKWNFIAIIWELFDFNISSIKKKMIKNSDINVWSLSAPIFINWVDFSDHRNYWLLWYKAYMITDTAFYRNKNYHTTWDTIDTLDFKKMNEVVKWIYWIIMWE